MDLNYKESERRKALQLRDALFKDPGRGIYRNKKREFVLADSEKNLWPPIRQEAIRYFKTNGIVWWPGGDMPTGHLLSSQICCINHLFYLRKNKQAALRLLQNLNSHFVEVCADFEDGYIGFEVVSNGSYLNEIGSGKNQTRGANCTSVDAMMTGILENGKKIQVLIEWKYTEAYTSKDLSAGSSGLTRKSRYDHLITDSSSPINLTIDISNLYHEPFYQLMRQTLLAWQMVENKDAELNTDDWMHVDVIPENNINLRYNVPAPDLKQYDLETSWKSQLVEPEKYRVISPQQLLQPLIFDKKHRGLIKYLFTRYW